MPADDAAAALRHLGDERLEELLAAVPSHRADELRRLLAYPADTAGGLMSPDVRTAQEGESAEAIRARLASPAPRLEGLATVFVLAPDGSISARSRPARCSRATPLPSRCRC